MLQYQKGELVHTFSTTLKRRRTEEEQNIIQRVLIDDDAVKKGETYIFEVSRIQRSGEMEPIEFETSIHNSDYSFTFPKQVAEENDIYPGDYVTFNVFTRGGPDTQENAELDEMKDKSNSRFLDTFTAYSANDARDGLGSRGNSVCVGEYLGEETKPILVVNKRNEKEAVYRTSAHKDGRRFSLPISIRETLDLEAGDVCEVYKVNDEDGQDQPEEDSTQEQINQIYQMVSELYEAYEQDN